jgi:hypothetical protein
MRLHIDLDAASWFILAFIVVSFGILPVLVAPLLLGVGPIGDTAFLISRGALTLVVYSVAASLLVRARPWRRLVDLILALFLLSLLGAVLMAMIRFVADPGSWRPILLEVIPATTFGIVQFRSLEPLRLGAPDIAKYVGVAIGLGVERWLLRRSGKPVGAQATPQIQPWPLPKGASSEESSAASPR